MAIKNNKKENSWINFCTFCLRLDKKLTYVYWNSADIQKSRMPTYEDSSLTKLHKCSKIVRPLMADEIEPKPLSKVTTLSEGSSVMATLPSGEIIKAIVNRVFSNGSVTLISKDQKGVIRVTKNDIKLV